MWHVNSCGYFFSEMGRRCFVCLSFSHFSFSRLFFHACSHCISFLPSVLYTLFLISFGVSILHGQILLFIHFYFLFGFDYSLLVVVGHSGTVIHYITLHFAFLSSTFTFTFIFSFCFSLSLYLFLFLFRRSTRKLLVCTYRGASEGSSYYPLSYLVWFGLVNATCC